MQTGKAITSNARRPSNVTVVPTLLSHIVELSETMREEDRLEIWHLARVSPREGLLSSFMLSASCKTVLSDGQVVAIFGCGRAGEVGVPWMLASPLLVTIKKTFLRECRKFLEEMSEGCKVLRNYAWSKNTVHIRWLQWLGFKMMPGVPMGPDQEVYIPFFKVISDV